MGLGKSLGLATGLLFAGVVGANAITLSPVSATCDPLYGGVALTDVADCGQSALGTIDVDRRAVAAALDDDITTFYSLGLGGTLLLDVVPASTGDVLAIEVTFNDFHPDEEALIELLYNGGVVHSETLANITGEDYSSFTVASGGALFDQIKFTDTSSGGSWDGFDLSTVAVVPVPAPALLLGAALVGLGAIRRRA